VGGWSELDSLASNVHTPWATTTGLPSGIAEARRVQPARDASVAADVAVPALQALGCGIAAAMLATGAAIWQVWPWWLPLATLGTVAPVVWAILLVDHRRALWRIEEIFGADLDGDSQAGPPEPEPPTRLDVSIEDPDGQPRHGLFVDLPAGMTADQFIEFARQVADGDSLAQGRWTGGGNLLSRAQFDSLMQRLERAGLVDWRDPTAPARGRQLTARGGKILAKIASEHARA